MRRKRSVWSLITFLVVCLITSMHCHAYKYERRPFRFKYIHNLQMSEDNREDVPLKIWKQTKAVLPPFVTGDHKGQRGDRSPLAALYNMFFVRIPIIATGLFYASKLSDPSWALICDLGFGQFEVPPTLVALAILVMLS